MDRVAVAAVPGHDYLSRDFDGTAKDVVRAIQTIVAEIVADVGPLTMRAFPELDRAYPLTGAAALFELLGQSRYAEVLFSGGAAPYVCGSMMRTVTGFTLEVTRKQVACPAPSRFG